MAETSVAISDIIVDCDDPQKVARFWGSLLGRPIAGRKGPYVWLARSTDRIGLGFQRVGERKQGKNRVHVDVSGPDVAAIKQKVEALGGSRVEGYEDGGFLVMADPEGNEFCVVPELINLDEKGRARYLPDLGL